MGEHKRKKPKIIIAKDMDDVQAKLQDRDLPEQNSGNDALWPFEHAIPLADRIAIPLRDLWVEYDDVPEGKSEADILISRTLALMFIICLMNYQVLNTSNLDEAFKTMQKMAQDFMSIQMGGQVN